VKYLLDANILIEANKRYYHNQIVPSFWQWLINDEQIYTIDKVKAEIRDGNDALYGLIKGVKTISYNQNIGTVSDHVARSYRDQAEISKFFSKADPILIATAIVNTDMVIVTNEVLVGINSQKIKIPNVCQSLGVQYKIGIFDILKLKQINLSRYSK